MKKSFTIILLALIASLASAQKGITFDVDKGLSAPKKDIPAYEEQYIATQIVNISGVPWEQHHVVKTSFEGKRLCRLGDDNFFKSLVMAYADHHPLVLSPDMVWLIISQGFSRYVNAHAEEMRDLLVFHEGKMELVVNSNNDVLSPSGDWERLLNDFSICIANNTKGELADLMTANFTTTGITERIASQISLMDVVKKYFIYTNIAAGCGIPSITLNGSPDDWQKVLDKVRCLKKYRLEEWASDLEVILKEFVKASKGKADKKFWRNIVKKIRVDQLKNEKRLCAPPKEVTYLDGWFLKFFPNTDGETPDSVMWDTDMPQEMVRVSFRHILTDPDTGEPIDTIPMQLWSGFVGIEENATTRALTPKIGWLARIADEESDEVARLKEKNKYAQLYFSLLNDPEVPHALSKMDHIRSLHLDFWYKPVVIPEWLDTIPIDKFKITGQFTDDEEAQLHQRFPQAEITKYQNIFNPQEQPEEDDDSNNIDSVLIVVNGKQLPKSLNWQLIKPRPRYNSTEPMSVEEALKLPIGPVTVNHDRHFNYDYNLKKDLRAYFLQRDEYVKEVRTLADAAAMAIYGEAGLNGAIEVTTRPMLSVAPLSPDESEALRQAYLSDVYANYRSGHTISTASAFGFDGLTYNGKDHALAPDLFDTPVEEQFFGQITYQHGHMTNEFLGALGSDSRGIYVPLIRQVEIKLPEKVDQAHVDTVVNAIRQAARQADKSIERTDSLVRIAFIFGGKVKEGKPHPFKTFPIKRDDSSDIESTFSFTPDANAASSWWAEAYFSPTPPSLLVMHLVSVDKLYASDCPAILENRRHYKGTVLDDESGKPVADALIYFETTMGISDAGGVRTDKKGHFDLWTPFDNEMIRVSKPGYKDATFVKPDEMPVHLIPASSSKEPPSPLNKVIIIGKGVKAGDTIRGTVSDDAGPLMGATVCERNKKTGRIVESAITDINGKFTLKVVDPQDELSFSYVGCHTEKTDLVGESYDIHLRPVEQTVPSKILRRTLGH
ncbi:MAG: DUF4419 domain-containing protein [Prevotella sp.]|nr:DUF4419 domain-containing protein [Prevotella sp.]